MSEYKCFSCGAEHGTDNMVAACAVCYQNLKLQIGADLGYHQHHEIHEGACQTCYLIDAKLDRYAARISSLERCLEKKDRKLLNIHEYAFDPSKYFDSGKIANSKALAAIEYESIEALALKPKENQP